MSLKDKDACQSLIKRIQTNGASLEADIQEACVQAIGHSVQHGNIMLAADIASALALVFPKGSRFDKAVRFMENFGALRFVGATQDKVAHFVHKKRDIAWSEEYEKEVREVQWFNFQRTQQDDNPVSIYDVEKDVLRLVTRAKARIKKEADGEKVHVEHEELLTDLQAVLDKHFAKKRQDEQGQSIVASLGLEQQAA